MGDYICECDNCGFSCNESEIKNRWPDIPHLGERVEPGGTVPAGECPRCGALTYRLENSNA